MSNSKFNNKHSRFSKLVAYIFFDVGGVNPKVIILGKEKMKDLKQ